MTIASQSIQSAKALSSQVDSKAAPKSQTKEAAKLLEGLFIRELMRAMGKNAGKSALFGKSMGQTVYQEMFHGALADQMSASGGIGLAEQIEDQLSRNISPQSTGISSTLAMFRAKASSQAVTDAVSQANGKQRLDGIRFEAPQRPRSSNIPKDSDGQFHSPIAGMPLSRTLKANTDTTISAAGSGRVAAVFDDGLLIEHQNGEKTLYRGMSEISAQQGDLVLRGQSIGEMKAEKTLNFSVFSNNHWLQDAEMTARLKK